MKLLIKFSKSCFLTDFQAANKGERKAWRSWIFTTFLRASGRLHLFWSVCSLLVRGCVPGPVVCEADSTCSIADLLLGAPPVLGLSLLSHSRYVVCRCRTSVFGHKRLPAARSLLLSRIAWLGFTSIDHYEHMAHTKLLGLLERSR